MGNGLKILAMAAVIPGGGIGIAACQGPAPTPPPPQGPDRYLYCAVAGNTDESGNPLGVGQTLSLTHGEPVFNKHYTGATLAYWVEGVGLTCQLSPAQAALAAVSTIKVNHVGLPAVEEGPQVYTFVPAG
jgi:hypothetical protein